MTFDEYANNAMRTAGPALTVKDALCLSALGLSGESGEFTDMVKKYLYHDHPLNKQKAIEELGDVLWYVSRACAALSVSLEEVAVTNIRKLQQRYPEGFSSERSINRKQNLPGLTGYSGFTAPEMATITPCSICGATGWHSFSCTNKGY